METLGEEVYRLLGSVIDEYVRMFTECEEKWFVQVHRHKYFTSDFFFVSTLPNHTLRIYFWLDKINSLSHAEFIFSLEQLQRSYIQHAFWRLPPYIFTREESELFYLLYLYFSDMELRESVPELANNIKNFYTVIGL